MSDIQILFSPQNPKYLDSKTNPFEEGENDVNHGVPLISKAPITRSKASKIQQSFIPHVQQWIGSVHHEFHVSHTNTKDEGPFGDLKVNVFLIEVDCGVDIKLP